MTAGQEFSIEIRRQAVQSQFDATRTGAERNRLGQFATPNSLAVDIAQYVDSVAHHSLNRICFADPSLGTGSFFSAALSVFGDRIERAVGVELDPVLCTAARELWQDYSLEVIRGDFTALVAGHSPPESPNLLLANPPYVRHHHIERQDKERLQALARRVTGIEVSGLAGLYVYFVLLATSWLMKGGYAAWLIPTEFMDVNYGTALKQFLTDHVTLIRTHRFDPSDVQFGDALVSSAVLLIRNSKPQIDHVVEFTFGGSINAPHRRETIPIEELRQTRKWTALPHHAKNDRRPSSTIGGPTLGDFFLIRRGIATGDNKFFIIERAEADRRRLPDKYLIPILPSPRALKTTIIEAASDGYPVIDNQLCLIDCDLPEDILRRKHPTLWEYLETADSLGTRDGYLVGRRSPWYKQEHREPSPFVCTYMGRGSDDVRPFRFIWNRSRAVATNLYLMLYPQKGLKELLRHEPGRAADVFGFLQQITGQELRGEGRVYGGGLNKIEPSELARVSAIALVECWPALASDLHPQRQLFG